MTKKREETKNDPTNVSKIKTGAEVISEILEKKIQTNKKIRTNTNEKLKIVVDSLKASVSDESFLVFKSLEPMVLNKSKVKNALDQLLSGGETYESADGQAHVVLDTGGGLFSSDLIEEQRSSVECLRTVQKIIDSVDGGSLGKPLIIITETNKRVKIVVLNPITNSQIRLNFIDPFSGARDIQAQTHHCIFEQYLRMGSVANQIKPLNGLVDNMFYSDHKTNIVGCNREEDSGWWCLYYCLLFIHEGVDPTSTSNWPHKDTISRVKTVLATHVDLIQKSDDESPSIDNNCQETVDLKEFRQVDQAIRVNLTVESNQSSERIERLIKMSPSEKIREHERQLMEKTELSESLKAEIEHLEATIKESVKTLSQAMKDTSTATTESKFKQLVSGDHRRVLEAHMKKMEEKQTENLLANNKKVREEKYIEEIQVLKEQLALSAAELEKQEKQKNAKLQEINKNEANIKNYKKLIGDLEKEITICRTADIKLKSDLNDLNKTIDDINKVDLYKNTDDLISLLIMHDQQNIVSSIRDELTNLKRKLIESSNGKNEKNKILDAEVKRKNEVEILLDSEKGKMHQSENRLSQINVNKSQVERRLAEYDSWWWRLWYPGTVSQIENELKDEKQKLNQESCDLSGFQRNVSDYEGQLNNLTSSISRTKLEIASLETSMITTESSIASEKEKFKRKRDSTLEDLVREQKSKSKEIVKNENEILGNTEMIKSQRNQIEIAERTLDSCKKEIKNIKLVVVSYQKEMRDNENKMKKIEKTLAKYKQEAELKKKDGQNSFEHKPKTSVLDSNAKKIKRNKEKKLYFDSEILSPNCEKQLIDLCHFSNQKWKLLYRASRDEFDAAKFHSHCDGHHNTLTLICTSESNVFGGYTSAAWSSNNCFTSDNHSFILSLKNDKNVPPFLVKCIEPTEAILCDKQFGPCFGYDDIKISNRSDTNVDSVCKFGYSYEHPNYPFGSEEANSILTGSPSFQTCEIEVFAKDYNLLTQAQIESDLKKNELSIQEIHAFHIFHAIAINGEISKEAFVAYLEQKISFFKNQQELKEMRSMFELMFIKFDADASGKLDFYEFLISVELFDSKDASEIPKIVFGFLFEMADEDKNGLLDKKELDNLIKQFPINKGLKKLLKRFDSEISKRGVESSITKEQGIELFCNFYKDDSESDDENECWPR